MDWFERLKQRGFMIEIPVSKLIRKYKAVKREKRLKFLAELKSKESQK